MHSAHGEDPLDEQQIKAATHAAAAEAAAAQPPFVNRRDPAQALGPDGKPAVSRRAPQWADVPDEKWNDWRWQMSHRVNDVDEIGAILELTEEEREGLSAPEKFRVDITPYFISLIDPNDPNDPIRRQVIPLGRENQAFTAMMEDSLAEDRHSPVPGLVHRYPDRVLMLVTTQCASYCRYCTRSRIVGDATQNFNRKDHEAQLEYLRRTPQVRDVLISGGDGLTLAPKLFESILRGIREIPHIEIVRIGSRVPVFLPQRIDDELCDMMAKYHPLWMNLHFNHPNEITPEVSRAVDKLTRAGIPVGNQSVLLAGVNDCVQHPAGAGPQAGREPHPALLPVPVRPGRRVGPLPHAGRQGPGDHRRPARPHQRLRRPDLRHRRARWRRQDPGHAQLPDQLLRPQGRAAQLRGLHHDLRGAADVPAARQGELRLLPEPAAGTRPERRARPARGRAPVDRAARLRGDPRPRQQRGAPPPGSPTSGCRTASAPSRAGPGRRSRSCRAATPSNPPARRPERPSASTVPARSRGRATASPRIRARGAALSRSRRAQPTGTCSDANAGGTGLVGQDLGVA